MNNRPSSQVFDTDQLASAYSLLREWSFPVLAGLVILLRLFIWKLLPGADNFVREDFSNIIVAIAILVLSFAWLLWKILQKKDIRSSGFEWPLLLFLGAAVGSIIYSVEFPSSLTGVAVLFAHILFFYLLQDILDSRRKVMVFLFFLLGCAVILSLYGIGDFVYLSFRQPLPTDAEIALKNDSLHYILVHRRVTSLLGWPNTLAGCLLLTLPFGLALAVKAGKLWQRGVYILIALAIVACFLFTFSFLGWLNFLLGALVLTPLAWRMFKVRDWPKSRRIVTIGAVVVFLILFGWVILRKDFAVSIAPRKIYYKNAVALLKDRPFRGHGWDTYGTALRKYADEKDALTAYVHNSYLQAWVETGVVGGLGLILLFVFFMRMVFVVAPQAMAAGESVIFFALAWGLTAFFIDNAFSFTILKPNASLHFWAAFAVFVAFCRSLGLGGKGASQKPTIPKFLVPSAVILAGVAVFYVLFRMAGAFLFYQQGLAAFKWQDLAMMERNFNYAQEWDPWHSRFPATLGEAYLKAYLTTGRKEIAERAEVQYWKAINREPLTYGYYLILSKLYGRLGDKYKEDQMAREARVLSPYEFDRDTKLLAEMALKAQQQK